MQQSPAVFDAYSGRMVVLAEGYIGALYSGRVRCKQMPDLTGQSFELTAER